jgi:tRNA threonylcarbamoyladenosine biosynthesis protein TsaB
MSDFILHIDTASSRGLVMISEKGVPVAFRINQNPHEHAAFVQPAIRELLDETDLTGRHFKCLAVANGPGSYTGLRVGLASAKGLCYTWQVPLCTLSSLKIMALATRDLVDRGNDLSVDQYFLAPMIDARRMEVFYALYQNQGLNEIIYPGSMVLDELFLENVLANHPVCFSGDGAVKWKSICNSPNARFFEVEENENAFAQLAWQASNALLYVNIVHAEPFYSKEFFSPGFVIK